MRLESPASRTPRLSPLAAALAVLLVPSAALLSVGPTLLTSAHDAAHGQPPPPRRPDQVRDLAPGKLLVAARQLPDPNFADVVVLLVAYDEQHAMGLIVNRQTDVPLSRVFQHLKQAREQSAPVFLGGPVEVTGALALLRSDHAPADSRRLFADVHVISTRRGLEDLIATRSRPDRFRVYLGYAGWGRGQLQMETARGAWHVFPGDAGVVFDPEPDSVWPRQIRRADERVLLARSLPNRLPSNDDAALAAPILRKARGEPNGRAPATRARRG